MLNDTQLPNLPNYISEKQNFIFMRNWNKFSLILIICIFPIQDIKAQIKKDSVFIEDPFANEAQYKKGAPAIVPQFKGDMQDYISINSEDFKRTNQGLSGRVKIICTINKKGEVLDARVMNSCSAKLDKEALRLVSSMPNWIPGKLEGVPIDMSQIVDIKF